MSESEKKEQTEGKPFLHDEEARIRCRSVNIYYGEKHAVNSVSVDIGFNEVTAFIGPSGCGKSTFIRAINRMNDTIPICRTEGSITIDGEEIYASHVDTVELRARVGMVFQKPNPFPKSIYNNVAYGPRIHGIADNKDDLDEIVQRSLEKAGLWKEVKDNLHHLGTALSGGQQQRLCIARALAIEPEIILMDEPSSALDPASTLKIEELMDELKKQYTIILVTHNMQQAARASDYTGFLYLGELIEFDVTNRIFTKPREKLTENYITGRFG